MGLGAKTHAPVNLDTPSPLKDIVAAVERDILENAIKTYGSVNKVAELFQVDRTTIFRKLKGGRKETERSHLPWT